MGPLSACDMAAAGCRRYGPSAGNATRTPARAEPAIASATVASARAAVREARNCSPRFRARASRRRLSKMAIDKSLVPLYDLDGDLTPVVTQQKRLRSAASHQNSDLRHSRRRFPAAIFSATGGTFALAPAERQFEGYRPF